MAAILRSTSLRLSYDACFSARILRVFALTTTFQIIGSRALGGAERFFIRLAHALAEKTDTHCILPPDSVLLGGLADSIPVTTIPMRSVWDVSARYRIRRAISQAHPDVVQTWMGRATRLTKLPKKWGIAHIARLGGYYDVSGYAHAHAWVGNTRGICDYLIAEGLPADRVFHIGNFYEPSMDPTTSSGSDVRERLSIGGDDWLILTTARLHPNKGIADLLEAIALVPDVVNERKTRFVIAGDGPLYHELQSKAAELGLDERVYWTGWIEEPAPFYQAADLFVCPSRHEPLGNVILEAWFHELPIVSTANQGALELITDRHDGIVTPLQDPKSLSEAIIATLGMSDNDRAELVEQGKTTLISKHSRQTITDAYLALYDQLTG